MSFGLTTTQRETIRRILATFADQIERVAVFGSRAMGSHRPNSDLDLVIHGSLDEKAIDRLWTLFHESSLPFSVDVKSYERTTYAPLQAHINEVSQTLFTHEELAQAKRPE